MTSFFILIMTCIIQLSVYSIGNNENRHMNPEGVV